MTKTRQIISGVVAAIALAATAAVYAQPCTGPGTGQGYGPGAGMGQGAGAGQGYGPGAGMGHGRGGMGMGPGSGAMADVDPVVMAETRLANFKAQLNLTTAEQQAAWNDFAATARAQAEARKAMRATMQATMHDPKTPAPDRMALRATAMQQRAAAMQAMVGPFNSLYSTLLTPEQKLIADQHGGMMGGKRGMHGGRGACTNAS
jgi:hypothetical protein